jgi:hypothetical protein
LEDKLYLKSQDEYPSGMECWSKLSRLAMELALNKENWLSFTSLLSTLKI